MHNHKSLIKNQVNSARVNTKQSKKPCLISNDSSQTKLFTNKVISQGGEYSSTTEDVVMGLFKCIAIGLFAVILFSLGHIAESLIVFGIGYCVFFYALCMAGTTPNHKIPYINGSAWLAMQKARPRTTRRRSYATSNTSRTIDSDDTSFDAITSSSSVFLSASNDTYNDIFDTTPFTTYSDTVNPATGLPMLGATDVAGNLYGSSSNDDFTSFDSTSGWDDNISSTSGFDDDTYI